MDDTPHHLSNNTAETPPPLTSGDLNTSHYYVVQISEYDAMKAEIERLRRLVGEWSDGLDDALDEIERLRALCNDLHHDATCAESFCRLCGEGIREWEATRG